MFQKTEPADEPVKKSPVFISRGLILQLCIITLLVLAILVGLEWIIIPRILRRADVQLDSPLVYPWITVGSTTLRYALRGFDLPMPSVAGAKIYLLAGMLLTFVFCPTIALFGWRTRRLERQHLGAHYRPALTTLSSIGYGICAVVVSFVVLSIGPLTLVQTATLTSRCESEEARLLRYETLSEMDHVVSDVVQYRFLPKEIGGGSGSYAGYRLPTKLARTEKAEYTVDVKPDTVLVKAESALCATNTIRVTLNSVGRKGFYMYEGNWGYG